MYDIIIIGAGPAGMTAALYASRANKKVLVLEAITYGGQIIRANKIDNYPGLPGVNGVDFATSLYNQIITMGATVKFEKVIDIDYPNVKTSENTYQGRAIIIATGATNKKLNLANEDKFIGQGISYCATCDGNFYKDKVVAVYGNSNTALEDAIYLADICSKVYLIRSTDRVNEELANNIEIIANKEIKELVGDSKLERIVLNDNQILDISCLFVAIGQVPESNTFTSRLDLDQKGYVISNDMKTKYPGIYVCGDIRSKRLRQLATAISDGAEAVTMAISDINNNII